MMMPKMDGAATIKALKNIDPEVKIIATSGLTALTDPGSEASIKEAKAFIPKPFTTESLLRTLRQVILEKENSVIQSR